VRYELGVCAAGLLWGVLLAVLLQLLLGAGEPLRLGLRPVRPAA
jgi:hypothetical protein